MDYGTFHQVDIYINLKSSKLNLHNRSLNRNQNIITTINGCSLPTAKQQKIQQTKLIEISIPYQNTTNTYFFFKNIVFFLVFSPKVKLMFKGF